jgi:hypothetical protein
MYLIIGMRVNEHIVYFSMLTSFQESQKVIKLRVAISTLKKPTKEMMP